MKRDSRGRFTKSGKARKARGTHRSKNRGKNVSHKTVKFMGAVVTLTAPKARKRKARTARSVISGARKRSRRSRRK